MGEGWGRRSEADVVRRKRDVELKEIRHPRVLSHGFIRRHALCSKSHRPPFHELYNQLNAPPVDCWAFALGRIHKLCQVECAYFCHRSRVKIVHFSGEPTLDVGGSRPHSLSTISLCDRVCRRPKISPHSPRRPDHPPAQRRKSGRHLGSDGHPRAWIEGVYSTRRSSHSKGQGVRQGDCRGAYQGPHGVHRQEEAEKGLQEDYTTQADLHETKDRRN